MKKEKKKIDMKFDQNWSGCRKDNTVYRLLMLLIFKQYIRWYLRNWCARKQQFMLFDLPRPNTIKFFLNAYKIKSIRSNITKIT